LNRRAKWSYLSRLDVSTHTVWERSKGGNKLGVHRRMVREALADAVPENERSPSDPGRNWKQQWLSSRRFWKETEQRHESSGNTAHRIWCRSSGDARSRRCGVLDSSIRSGAKIQLRLVGQETFIPQSYAWGGEAQVDWYEAYADICGERELAYVFCMRSMASGGAFHCAFPHASQQAFLEAHERAFAYFSGVFKTLRYDNSRVR